MADLSTLKSLSQEKKEKRSPEQRDLLEEEAEEEEEAESSDKDKEDQLLHVVPGKTFFTDNFSCEESSHLVTNFD